MGAPAGNPRRRSRDTQGRENTSLGIRARDRYRTGWRAVLDPGTWLRSLLLAAVFVVSMSALACVVGLARDTTGHDWHATGKLFLAEILLALNFDPRAPVAYRTREGAEVTLPAANSCSKVRRCWRGTISSARRSGPPGSAPGAASAARWFAWCWSGGKRTNAASGAHRTSRAGRGRAQVRRRPRPRRLSAHRWTGRRDRMLRGA